MIDLVKLALVAGAGGNGRVSFRREKFVLKGGPDGGYGGDGGDIIFQGDSHFTTLKHLAGVGRIEAPRGGVGSKKKMHGANSEPIVIKVPLGTVVWVVAENDTAKRRRGESGLMRPFKKSEIKLKKFFLEKETERPPLIKESEEPEKLEYIYDETAVASSFRVKNVNLSEITKYELAKITENGQEVVVCQGGFGGRGNIAFKNSRNTTPLEAEYGTPGERRVVLVELKLLANVGLVGFPNAGKSTLISRVTKANPKIAAYPFTTLEPHLGIWQTQSGRELVVADIPGLVEGASEGKGLGFSFLRHIEACQVLLYVLSLEEAVIFDESLNNADKAELVWQQYLVLKKELEQYGSQVLTKSYLIGINKADLYNQELAAAIQKRFSKNKEVTLMFSGFTGLNLNLISSKLERLVD